MPPQSPHLNTVLSVIKFTGTFPFDSDLSLSRKEYLITLTHFLLSIILKVHSVIYPTPYFTNSPVRYAANTLEAIGGILVCFFNIAFVVSKAKVLKSVQENITNLRVLFPTPNKPRLSKIAKAYLHFFCILIVKFFIEGVFYVRDFLIFRDFIVFLSNGLFQISLVGQFLGLLVAVSMLHTGCKDLEQTSFGLSQYEQLQSTIEMIREVYEPQIFLTISWNFLLIVFSLYSILSPNYNKDSFTILCVLWLIYLFSPIIFAIGSCTYAINKANKFNQELYNSIKKDENGDLASDQLVFHFTAKRELSFSACGFFALDNSLICSMIVTITTYLVIVLQYGKDTTFSSYKI